MYSFYDPLDGKFTGVVFNGPATLVGSATPPGHKVFEGAVDHLRYKFDQATNSLVEYVPDPPPTSEWLEYEWDSANWRWKGVPTLKAVKASRVAEVDVAIQSQEVRRVRPNTELLLALAAGAPMDPALVTILQETESQLSSLRSLRSQIEAASTKEQLSFMPPP